MSYTWGDQSKRSTIVFDEPSVEQANQLSVTTNSVSALRRLQCINSLRVIRMVQICVNQANTQERNHQIQPMTRIHTQAEGITIYLGENHDDSDLTMYIVGDIHDSSTNLGERVLKSNTDMLRSLFGRSWFSRIWVLQEVATAQSAAMNCGHRSLNWDVF